MLIIPKEKEMLYKTIKCISITMNSHGQALTLDLVIALVIFVFIIGLVITPMWNRSVVEISRSEIMYGMEHALTTVSEQLVRTTGVPENWQYENATVFGLADVKTDFGSRIALDRVLDPDKLLRFVENMEEDYNETRNMLLGSGKYDLYINITCINKSQTDCLEGLYLDTVNNTVACTNPYNFTVIGNRTAVYKWIEAEDFKDFGTLGDWSITNPPTDNSSGNASISGNQNTIPANITIDLRFESTYNVWVGYLDESNRDFKIIVNDISYEIKPGNTGEYLWNRTPPITTSSANIILNATGPPGRPAIIDTILITSDPDYEPAGLPACGTFGCDAIKACTIGSWPVSMDDVAYIMSDTKFATFSEPKTDILRTQTFLCPTTSYQFVLWKEGVGAPPRPPVCGDGKINQANEGCDSGLSSGGIVSTNNCSITGDVYCFSDCTCATKAVKICTLSYWCGNNNDGVCPQNFTAAANFCTNAEDDDC